MSFCSEHSALLCVRTNFTGLPHCGRCLHSFLTGAGGLLEREAPEEERAVVLFTGRLDSSEMFPGRQSWGQGE